MKTQTQLVKIKFLVAFIVKNELFWGDDRMEDAIKWSLK